MEFDDIRVVLNLERLKLTKNLVLTGPSREFRRGFFFLFYQPHMLHAKLDFVFVFKLVLKTRLSIKLFLKRKSQDIF